MTFPSGDLIELHRYGHIGTVGRKLARRYQAWHVSPQRCTADSKVLHILDASISVVFQTTELCNSTVGNRRVVETGQFLMELNLIADESCQIRHTALRQLVLFPTLQSGR